MIPCLYDQVETAFDTNGIGKLCDAISCSVVEKRNGSYELKMTYPADGLHAEEITEGALILAKPSEGTDPQPFRIYKITTPLTGVLEVAARHIQYQQNYITVSPFMAIGSQAAMQQLALEATTACPFTFWTDIDSAAVFSFKTPSSIRSCLGGMDGSMLDTYGGEYEWNMYEARLHAHRGSDYGVRIVYGKNLVDFKMEKSIENIITGIHPYWLHSEDGTLVELPEKVVTVEDHGLPYEKISPLDCSSQFNEKPTEVQLRDYAQEYLKSTTLTEPDIDIDIDFVQLWQTPGYADIAAAERVSLCDTVHVYIVKLGIEVSCKVTETDYDVLLERYNSITLSNATVYSRNSSLSSSLGSISDEANLATEAINRVETNVTDVRTYTVQQEYFNLLASGLLGVHYSSGTDEEGATVRYAHTSEKLADSKYAWMSGSKGFFVSMDGGVTWQYGWANDEAVVKPAVEAVGLSADALLSGVLKTSLVKILGTENFYWRDGAIVMTDPADEKRLLKIGQYSKENYGIAVSGDGGESWTVAVDFDGVAGNSSGGTPTVVQGETIVKSDTEPSKPSTDSLWVDKANKRLKLWDGSRWVTIGYEPEDSIDPEEKEPEDGAEDKGPEDGSENDRNTSEDDDTSQDGADKADEEGGSE